MEQTSETESLTGTVSAGRRSNSEYALMEQAGESLGAEKVSDHVGQVHSSVASTYSALSDIDADCSCKL